MNKKKISFWIVHLRTKITTDGFTIQASRVSVSFVGRCALWDRKWAPSLEWQPYLCLFTGILLLFGTKFQYSCKRRQDEEGKQSDKAAIRDLVLTFCPTMRSVQQRKLKLLMLVLDACSGLLFFHCPVEGERETYSPRDGKKRDPGANIEWHAHKSHAMSREFWSRHLREIAWQTKRESHMRYRQQHSSRIAQEWTTKQEE